MRNFVFTIDEGFKTHKINCTLRNTISLFGLKRNAIKVLTFNLVLVALIFHAPAFSRGVKLIKTNGATIHEFGVTSASYSDTANWITPTYPDSFTVQFDEVSVNYNRNWSDMFRFICAKINFDPENSSGNAAYEIIIESEDASHPMMVGKQYDGNFYPSHEGVFYKRGQGILGFSDEVYPLNETIKNITIHSSNFSINGKAYFKFVDGLNHGSFIKPNSSFTYYMFRKGSDTTVYCSTVNPNNAVYWPGTTTPVSSFPIQQTYNTGSTEVSIDTIAPYSPVVWKNVFNDTLRCFGGALLACWKCENASVSGLEVDMNGHNAKIGGIWGDRELQLLYTGFSLAECQSVSLNSCTSKNAALDGVAIQGGSNYLISLNNVECDFSGRNGLTWTGGDSLKATNCTFKNTGRKTYTSNNKMMATSPASGIDIEPEGGCDYVCSSNPGWNLCNKCTNGVFKNCIISDNAATAIVNDASCAQWARRTESIYFIGGSIRDTSSYGIWVKGLNINFDNVSIEAAVKWANSGNSDYDALKFSHCTFKDATNWASNTTPSIIEYDGSKRVSFKSCTFELFSENRRIVDVYSPTNADSLNEFTLFENCNFVLKTTVPSLATDNGVFRYCRFKGINTFDGTLLSGCNRHQFELYSSLIEGADNSCASSQFVVKGKVEINFHPNLNYGLRIGKKTDNSEGFAQLVIKDNGLVKFIPFSGIYPLKVEINPFSTIDVQMNGTIACGAIFENSGLLKFRTGSYVCLNSNNVLQFTGNGKIFASKFANPNGINFNPFWTTCASPNTLGNWIGNTQTNCILGGHTASSTNLPSPFSYQICNPNFENWVESGTLNLFYQINHSTCFGSNTGSIILDIVGGIPPYTLEINGSTPIPFTNTVSGLLAGTYTLTVVDFNGCEVSTTVQITQPNVLTVSLTSSNILCNGGTSTITATGNGGIPSYEYSMDGINYQTSTMFTGNTAGTYTISIKDSNSCSSTATVTITQPALLTWQSSFLYNIGCSGSSGSVVVNAAGGTTPYQYSINGSTFQPSNTLTFQTAGNYTVTAKDANGCTTTLMFHAGSPVGTDHCCNITSTNIVNTPQVILYTNPSASDIIAVYGSTLSNRTLYISGVFTIDDNITFDNCTLYFTPSGIIQFNNNAATLNINTSTLLASCDWWGGVITSNSLNKVKITSNSTVKNAINGVSILNDALLEASNSHFVDNGYSCIGFGNMTSSNYNGFIKGCTFSTLQNLPAPYSKTRFGISSMNTKNLTIGGLANNEGNVFDGMETGIWLGVSSNTINPQIKIYNNSFNNIKADYSTSTTPEADLINNCYQTYKGAAIMAYYGGPPAQNAMDVEVKNSNPASSALAFTNCDKGIVTVQAALTAENLYMDYVPMGIMNYNIIGTTSSGSSGGNNYYDIRNNKIINSFLGMQFAGEKGNSIIKDNSIECTLYPNGIQQSSVMGSPIIWPKGIDILNYLNNNNSNSFDISINNIKIPHYAGIGISVLNGHQGISVEDNPLIELTTNDVSILACAGATTLTGIAAFNSFGCDINGNTIYANTANSSFNGPTRIDATGILIDRSDEQEIGCNYIQNSRFGIMGWGQCNTSSLSALKIKGNTVHDADLGWVLRHLANEGTFGDVGDADNDNNNQFTGPPPVAKIFKFCEGLLPFDEIFTSSINQITESLSENIITQANDCSYVISPNNPGFVLFSPSNCSALVNMFDELDITLDEALAIATNTKVYLEYPALAHWYDCKRLFEFLDQNPVFRNSNTTLVNFYNNMLIEAIAQEEMVDQKLRSIIESFAEYSPAQLEGQLGDAESTNEDIDVSENQDENEMRINNIYLRLVRYGMDSILNEDKEFIEQLSPICPYIGGNAVYKARALNAFLKPGAMYDDMKICNAVGVYKQNTNSNNHVDSESLITKENNYLQNIKRKVNTDFSQNNELVIYPNPTDDIINVVFDFIEEGEFELYDLTGRKVLSVSIDKGNKATKIDLKKLSNGIYSYKLKSGSIIKSGKIAKT